MPPSKHIAIVACMDARLDVYRMLGIKEGRRHPQRRMRGRQCDPFTAIGQRLLGTHKSSCCTTPTVGC